MIWDCVCGTIFALIMFCYETKSLEINPNKSKGKCIVFFFFVIITLFKHQIRCVKSQAYKWQAKLSNMGLRQSC
ncbi:hypothetical protein CQA40_07300 [Helicobacter sp. MIT 01-3238]|nr:hypothetical protein CQA40_07300 [Helicobacter sp. MIT 01-3238]